MAGWTSRPQSGHLPSTSWLSVQKDLAGGAVQALIGALVDVALVVELFENLLHLFFVALVGGADEVVVG